MNNSQNNSSNNDSKNLLTTSQTTAIVYSTIVGVGILSLPNSLVKIAAQDGWISTIVGGVYPLYITLLAVYVSSKHPKEGLLDLNKRYLGKLLGTLFNIFFAAFFLFYISAILSGTANMIRVFIVSFLSPTKIFVVSITVVLYLAYRGLKPLGRVSEVLLYLSIGLAMIPITALKYGTTLNISPVFGSGIGNILKGSLQSIYAYGGAEVLLIIYPYMKDTKKIKTVAGVSTALVVLVYTWLTFITIYYLGPDLILKMMWPTIAVAESVRIPIISTFRFIFMFLWTVSAFKTLAAMYYSAALTLHKIYNKIDMKLANYIVYPLAIGMAYLYGDEVSRRGMVDKLVPMLTLISTIDISLLCLLVFIKSRGKKSAQSDS